jgi:hypothetical protein
VDKEVFPDSKAGGFFSQNKFRQTFKQYFKPPGPKKNEWLEKGPGFDQ